MTLAAPPFGLPPAHGGCTCSCHRVPGILHFAPCCRPSVSSPVVQPVGYSDADALRDLQESILQSTSLADFMAVKKTVEAIREAENDRT